MSSGKVLSSLYLIATAKLGVTVDGSLQLKSSWLNGLISQIPNLGVLLSPWDFSIPYPV